MIILKHIESERLLLDKVLFTGKIYHQIRVYIKMYLKGLIL